MAPRIRTLKPEISEDEALGSVSREARLLFLLLITQADDDGRLRAAPGLLRGRLFPYDDDVTAAMVAGWLAELEVPGLARCYAVEGEHYADLPSFPKNQKIDRPTKSLLPSWEDRDGALGEPSTSPRRALDDGMEGRGMEGKGTEPDRARARDEASTIEVEAFGARQSIPPALRSTGTDWAALLTEDYRSVLGRDPLPSVLPRWMERAEECERGGRSVEAIRAVARRLMADPKAGPGLLPHKIDELDADAAKDAERRAEADWVRRMEAARVTA